ncbi:G-protein coupled receptor family C group 6 member A-like [Osmerus eperlanus]|uniref:G-protein coupled receptor family C group 6 member A-like n=1 Tax=Osmerus eperlanus TaxID=29151 RepID=UPI002E1257D7
MVTCVSLLLFLSVFLLPTLTGGTHEGATASGDIIIGGIFPFHDDVEENTTIVPPHEAKCVRFNSNALNSGLAMINTVELVNQSPSLSRLGLKLGYRIQDSCSDVTTALRAINGLRKQGEAAGGSLPPITSIVGASSSEISIAVARQLNLELIPQISHSSTATILSDKKRFPGFLRTVPSDLYQTKAMVRLMEDSGWSWVGVVIADNDYGRSALNALLAQTSKRGICVAFKETIPNSLSDPDYSSAVTRVANVILTNPRVKVVVAFVTAPHMEVLLPKLKALEDKQEESASGGRVWLASDGWSSTPEVARNLDLESIGQVVGFTFKSSNLESYRQYLQRLNETKEEERRRNPFLDEFLEIGELDLEELGKKSQAQTVFSVELAVRALAQAVIGVCSSRNCTQKSIEPWEVLRALKQGMEFQQDGETYFFDKNGEINLGYKVTLWNSKEGKVQVGDIVAEYLPFNDSFTHTILPSAAYLTDLKEVVSRCSESCLPGQIKQTFEGQQHTCCYKCINCTENHYSNSTDMDYCLACDTDREWSDKGSSRCIPKTLEYFSWDDGFAVVLLTLAALGILLSLLVGALFLHQRHTPVVKAAGGGLCQVILLSLIGSFISAMVFVGKPSDLTCKVRQVLFGLSFTLCVSCILVKSLKILLAFQLNPALGQVFRRLYQPLVIVCGCLVLQLLTCLLWLLLLSSPRVERKTQATSVLAECHEGSDVAFGVMLSYIAVLALVCFLCAFKGRKLPQKYNEAKFITFGMLLYLISWAIFVPVYINTSGKYLPAVEMVVILISSYGILCCHFLPKCYIILFRKEHNTKDAFIQDVHNYAFRGLDTVSVSECNSPEDKCTGPPFTIGLPSTFLPRPHTPTAPRQVPAGSQGYLNRHTHLRRCTST